MRPYRGQTKDGKWVYGWLQIWTDGQCFINNDEDGIEVLPETVCQQTGLKEKDWYFDDILESFDKLRRYTIKWDDSKGRIYLHGLGKAWCMHGDEIDWDEYTKVGNIHSSSHKTE